MADNECLTVCIACICVVIIMAILLPIVIVPMWEEQISEQTSDVEIPGFEPFIFLGVVAVVAIVSIIRYHIKHKRNQ